MAPLNLTGIYLPSLLSALLQSRIGILKEAVLLFEIYDYIIVGSGPGGSMLANRLAQNDFTTVLLIEAGGQDNVTSEIPLLTYPMIRDNYDWMYETTPQDNACWNAHGKKCVVASGKVVGGSSTLGFAIHTRGNKLDYDGWEALGNPGWSYDNVLPYFKKYEDYHDNGGCTEDNYHGCGGDVPVNVLGEKQGILEGVTTKHFLHGLKELGYKETDFNGEEQIGFNRGQYSIKEGVRQSAATTLLRPIQHKSNLHILLNSFVHKILIDSVTKKATGVEFEKGGEIKQVKAKKEIIISAGTYSSPKILMLSGIGPKEELEKLKIPLVVNLPGVGHNLQDIISVHTSLSTGRVLTEEEGNIINTETIQKWANGLGIMTSPAGFDAFAFVKSKYAIKESPDLMMKFQSLNFYRLVSHFVEKAFGFTKEIWTSLFDKLEGREFSGIHTTLIRPKSKGSVKLRSNDPHDLPLIDPNYLSDDEDRKILIEGLKIAEKIVNTSCFREKHFTTPANKLKECNEYVLHSDDYFGCYLKYAFLPKWSGCCTNKMGPESDSMSVVDNRLRVRGVDGLRIVDASIFPQQISGMPGAAVLMVGEKAASMIIEDN